MSAQTQTIHRILFPMHESEREGTLLNVLRLSSWFQAELFVLAPPAVLEESSRIFAKLSRGIQGHYHFFGFDEIEDASAVLDFATENRCDLMILYDRTLFGPTTEMKGSPLLQLSQIPVLILPRFWDLSDPPIASWVVPLSGEAKQNQALQFALRVSTQTGTFVDLVHVSSARNPKQVQRCLEMAGDAAHHEIPKLLEQVVAEASPFSNPEERSRVRQFYYRSGITPQEITEVASHMSNACLVVEWSGTLRPGRAEIVKALLTQTDHPLLFVRKVEAPKSRLRIAGDFAA